MSAARPNLARRPFVDTRPVNVTAAILLLAAVVLTAVSVRTVHAYLDDSKRSREAVASLRAEIERFEASRLEAEQKLARFDLDGMRAGAEEANALARLRSFSWSRFLTRLEKTLPNDVRVERIGLTRNAKAAGAGAAAAQDQSVVTLGLVSRDPDALPRLIRDFYASPWFDEPTPVSESGGEKGNADGRIISIEVLYRDRGGKP